MRHWKALSRWRRRFYLAVAGVPLLGFGLYFAASILYSGRLPQLSSRLAVLCLFPAAALLLGFLNLLLVWTGHEPKKDGWNALLALSLLPSLIFLGIALLVVTLPLWFPGQR